ncbi:MAG TPA: 3-phosphoserine/phosphohydroxythreonine transaminase [Steroidobacteraceae bacterium]|nr:3-phosphoserine/phosphohydroxythreonine transaminase [Steroidobacteraceae bacterium]
MRAFNFAAGPATLPVEVLEQAREELTDWHGLGASVMEISHRGKPFLAMAREAENDLRELLAVPAGYRVLFMQGGGAAQFSLVPLNLSAPDASVDYLVTGHWSKRAIAEAQRLIAHVNVAADEGASNYTTAPRQEALRLSAGAAYVHYCPNETIGGVEFPYVPETGAVPLVADMSSTILSRPLEVSRFGLIYAGAQKNIGPSGLAVVIVREDLLGRARKDIPAVWSYRNVADEGSMFNTPPTFAWYLAGLVFKWLKAQGGLPAMRERNRLKAERLYAAIDGSGFYGNPVARECRSWMNVPFTLADAALEGAFATEARAAGLINLEGHRSVGGMRASIYNAMPLEGVEALIAFMRDFERRRG